MSNASRPSTPTERALCCGPTCGRAGKNAPCVAAAYGRAIANRIGKKAAGRLIDGREHNETPGDST